MIARSRLFCSFIFLSLFLLSCASTPPLTEKPTVPYPVELQWVRKSVEYDLLCIQVYRDAWQVVKKAAEKTDGPWTIVMDVDETVLDNSRYQEILWEKNQNYPFYWDEWIRSVDCPPIPGARAFLDSLHSLEAKPNVVFITNRTSSADSETEKNLRMVGLWQEGDLVMGKRGPDDSKEIRRKEVLSGTGRSNTYPARQILALFGDQLGDFVEYEFTSLADLKKSYTSSPDFGSRFFLLPNPLYGYWERNYK